jgi:AraC-like DNA-binding protein
MWVFNFITFVNLFIVFCILFFKRDNVLPNKILALLLLNPGINFLSNVLVLNDYLSVFPYLYFFAQITCFMFAPLVHIYVTLLIGKKIKKSHPLYLITIASMLLSGYFMIEFILMEDALQEAYLRGVQFEPYPVQMQIVNGIFILLQQIYFTVAAIEVYKYRRKIYNQLSSLSKTKIGYTTRFILLIWLLNLITIGLYITLPTIQVEYIYLPIVLTVIYFFILFFAISFNSIFTTATYEDFVTFSQSKNVQSTGGGRNTEVHEELHKIAAQLKSHLDEKESFRNPNLDLTTLSEEMKISPQKLSVAINKILGKNFYDLINELRVKKSMVLLREMPHLTIEGVAYDSGFNSRASFYRAFKKINNSTPSEYLSEK